MSPYLALIDTNILVYAVDGGEPVKQATAIAELDRLRIDNAGILSVQSLSEYFTVVTRKLNPPIPPEVASGHLLKLLKIWRCIPVTEDIVLEAVRGTINYGLSFWDAQIWAAAKWAGAREIVTEDFNHGQNIEGVVIRNPFTQG